MWIQNVSNRPYNSMELKNFKPNAKLNLDRKLSTYLLHTFPKWFKQCSAAVEDDVAKNVSEPEVPKVKVADESSVLDLESKNAKVDIVTGEKIKK